LTTITRFLVSIQRKLLKPNTTLLAHLLVIVDLASGTPPAPRAQALGSMALLASTRQATPGKIQEFIRREKLYGPGCGLAHIALLASAMISPKAQL